MGDCSLSISSSLNANFFFTYFLFAALFALSFKFDVVEMDERIFEFSSEPFNLRPDVVVVLLGELGAELDLFEADLDDDLALLDWSCLTRKLLLLFNVLLRVDAFELLRLLRFS